MIVYDGFDGDYLLSEVAQPRRPDFYRSERSYYSFGPYPNYSRADQFFRANEGCSRSATPTPSPSRSASTIASRRQSPPAT